MHDVEVSPVDFRSGDVVELAHVSLQVEGAAGRVSRAGDAALHVDPDSEFGQGVVGEATGLAVGDGRAGQGARHRSMLGPLAHDALEMGWVRATLYSTPHSVFVHS